MADNVPIDPSEQPGAVDVATDDIDGTHHPLFKIEFGESGEATPVDSSNPLPVEVKAQADQTYETDSVIVLNEISRKLDILIEYHAMLHGINLKE